VFAERSKMLEQLLRDVCPDLVLIEHFPFSKWALRQELLAVIEIARAARPQVRVVSSVRDYPAANEDATGGERLRSAVVPTLNQKFDAIVVHSDPGVVRLESQFTWAQEIAVPVHYTGYVSEKIPRGGDSPALPAVGLESGYVLVSSGGLHEGLRLATLCAAAWKQLDSERALAGRRMVIFAGLSTNEKEYAGFAAIVGDERFLLRPFSGDFLGWMKRADLSISQGGYNTTMNVLEARTRAILAPNPLMSDQARRSHALNRRGLVDVIDIETTTVDELARLIKAALARPRPDHELSLDGAQRTSEIIDAILERS
jgi:predicted glycosyltransferase